MAIPDSLGERQSLTDSGDQTSLTDLLNMCIKETRELDSPTESAVLGFHDRIQPEAQSPKSGFPGGCTAVKIDLTLSKLEASQGVIGDQATCKNIRGVRRFRQDDVRRSREADVG
ncbi:hypothetical protein Bbelb_282940 [Branchiostoma belcheri]|nr:hypothetical protein Bbelb_282940 [Branchiostoma belcheri]